MRVPVGRPAEVIEALQAIGALRAVVPDRAHVTAGVRGVGDGGGGPLRGRASGNNVVSGCHDAVQHRELAGLVEELELVESHEMVDIGELHMIAVRSATQERVGTTTLLWPAGRTSRLQSPIADTQLSIL